MITRHGIKMQKLEDGIYYDESRVQVPSGIAPNDDTRRAEFQVGFVPEPVEARKNRKSDEQKEVERQYRTLVKSKSKLFKHYGESYLDSEIRDILEEEKTTQVKYELALALGRTIDAISFVWAKAKNTVPGISIKKGWNKFHKSYMQVKRIQLELGQITQNEFVIQTEI